MSMSTSDILCSLSCVQVYLVAGGQNTLTASTELLVQGAAGWTEAGPLPHKMYGLRTVSINNAVIATGQPSMFFFHLDTILCVLQGGITIRLE